jgi:hypothetical protein
MERLQATLPNTVSNIFLYPASRSAEASLKTKVFQNKKAVALKF